MSNSKGLSVLIPIYNYSIYELAEAISAQAQQLSYPFEILCYDDGSPDQALKKTNLSVSALKGVHYKELPKNIGRSKIRNLLAKDSQYDTLLFIDCDSKILSQDYLKKYIEPSLKHPIIAGGTVYTQDYDPNFSLRLIYGKQREQRMAHLRMKHPYRYINLNNLLVKKEIYLQNQLDESISTYGHEDTKFGYFLKEKKIPVLHIDNPVDHCGLENNSTFLKKTKEGIKNFYKITLEGYGTDTKLYQTYSFLKKFKLFSIYNLYYKIFQSKIEKNLLSGRPSLFYFDLMKLKTLIDQKKS